MDYQNPFSALSEQLNESTTKGEFSIILSGIPCFQGFWSSSRLPFINLKAQDTFLSKHFHQSTPSPTYAPPCLMVEVFLACLVKHNACRPLFKSHKCLTSLCCKPNLPQLIKPLSSVTVLFGFTMWHVAFQRVSMMQ